MFISLHMHMNWFSMSIRMYIFLLCFFVLLHLSLLFNNLHMRTSEFSSFFFPIVILTSTCLSVSCIWRFINIFRLFFTTSYVYRTAKKISQSKCEFLLQFQTPKGNTFPFLICLFHFTLTLSLTYSLSLSPSLPLSVFVSLFFFFLIFPSAFFVYFYFPCRIFLFVRIFSRFFFLIIVFFQSSFLFIITFHMLKFW